MATKPEDRFKEQKTYEGFERDAKAAGLYDTFDATDLERAKTDVNYGYKQLERKKQYVNPDATEEERQGLSYSQQADRDYFDAKYSAKSSGSGAPTYSGALAAIKAYDDSLPGDKSSKYMTMIDNLFGQIAGDKFSYDAKNDPRYALAEEYAQRAMENQMAESALLTGGYGNSYAAASGQQVYTDYMNEAVNDMEDRAYQKWSAERDNKYNLLSIAQGLEEQAYNRAQTERQWQYQTEQDAKADAETKQTNAQAIVYDYIMTTGSIEGLSPEEIAATGWSEAYINSLVTKAQSAKTPEVNEPAFTAEQALSYYVSGNRSEKVKQAMLYHFGEDYAVNADAYYKNMTASTPATDNTVPVPEFFNDTATTEIYTQLESAGAYDYESAYNLLIAKGHKTTEAEAIAKGFASGRVDRTADSYVEQYLNAKEALGNAPSDRQKNYVLDKLADAVEDGRISEEEYYDIAERLGL